ncbi:MAG: hypothetical protein HOW97_09045 [Catenulispora sp.]|nr:hypothetical protein [Catenulispora sp.]
MTGSAEPQRDWTCLGIFTVRAGQPDSPDRPEQIGQTDRLDRPEQIEQTDRPEQPKRPGQLEQTTQPVAAIVREWLRARNIDRELGADDVMFQNLCGRAADGSWPIEARIFVRSSVLED